MRRCLLKKGDQSTAGGVVLEGEETCKHYGTALTFIGAQVYCHTCKTTGHIAARGPRWPDSMMGKEQALEGDICICNCNPPPVMLASQQDSYHSFESHHLAQMGYAPDGRPLPPAPRSASYDDRYVLVEQRTGGLIANAAYAIERASGTIEHGVTDSAGRTHLLSTLAQAEAIAVYLEA